MYIYKYILYMYMIKETRPFIFTFFDLKIDSPIQYTFVIQLGLLTQ